MGLSQNANKVYISKESVYIGIVIASKNDDHEGFAKNLAANGYTTVVIRTDQTRSPQKEIEKALKGLYQEHSKLILITYDDLISLTPPIIANIDGLDCVIALGKVSGHISGVQAMRRPYILRIFSTEPASFDPIDGVDIAVGVYHVEDIAALEKKVSFKQPLWNTIYTLIQFL